MQEGATGIQNELQANIKASSIMNGVQGVGRTKYNRNFIYTLEIVVCILNPVVCLFVCLFVLLVFVCLFYPLHTTK